MYSLLQKHRMNFCPQKPKILDQLAHLIPQKNETFVKKEEIEKFFPHLKNISYTFTTSQSTFSKALKIGVVLSGGQAPGGHNVISGLFDAAKTFNPNSEVIGFLGGPSGIVNNSYLTITEDLLAPYRNQGGFDLIGSGRTKIEKQDQLQKALETAQAHQLDGLVIIGGDDSNTNAALLAEFFLEKKCKTTVVGVPKTIDGDLKNQFVEISFGFDTAAKIYSEIIGNIAKDNLSAKKYYYFIKLMGRSASHLTLECALQIQPNLTFIGEEVRAKKLTIQDLVNEIADLICKRSEQKKEYGIILIPEGIIEFIPEFETLINELNSLLATDKPHGKAMEELDQKDKASYVQRIVSESSSNCFSRMPESIQMQLLLDRDPHGNVQVSKIETERLFIDLTEIELKKREKEGRYKGKFSLQPLFCGYEGRSGFPSNFDAQYCYALGQVAALNVAHELTGTMACVRELNKPVENWTAWSIPIIAMIHLEERMGRHKPVIKKALVDLDGPVFLSFAKLRDKWRLNDDYRTPGPIQFYGPPELTEALNLTLEYEATNRFLDLAKSRSDLLS